MVINMLGYIVLSLVFCLNNFCIIKDKANKSNSFGFGSVSYDYYIGEQEITNEEYCLFLNIVASDSDCYQLYTPLMENYFWGGIQRFKVDGKYIYKIKKGYSKYPVMGVSWYSAIRYINWLNYNADNISRRIPIEKYIKETEGDDKHGAYNTIKTSLSVKRNDGAIYYLPTRNEWTKACFYTGELYKEYH